MSKQSDVRDGLRGILGDDRLVTNTLLFLKKSGAVIKVKRELPEFPMPVRGDMLSSKDWVGWKKMIVFFFRKAGYALVESLIDKE